MARRIVDLSQQLAPGENGSPLQAAKYELPDVERTVHHRVTFEGAAGTHVVAPYRYLGWGTSIGEIAPERFFGEAVTLRVHAGDVGDAELEDASAGRLRLGDIAILAPASPTQPPSILTVKGAQWLFIRGAKLVALDASIAPGPAGDPAQTRDVLLALLENEVPVVLNLTQTAQLSDQRVALMALPSPVKGLDAWPVRVVALDPGAEPAIPVADVPQVPEAVHEFDAGDAAGDGAALTVAPETTAVEPPIDATPAPAHEPSPVDGGSAPRAPELIPEVSESAVAATAMTERAPAHDASTPTPTTASESAGESATGIVAEP
ncbi:MAG: cyclase family protein [Actinobacteria bacterium]|nr:cyclase family protein [Actinomycetota bacterium]